MILAEPAAAQSKKRSSYEIEERAPQGPLMAIVSIKEQRVTIYDSQGPIARSPVSTGQTDYETPEGIFAIIERNKEHYSNLYNDAPMPNMQRITWSGVALHAGNLPGYPASHGCIRLPHSFSERLFDMTKLGTRVIVAKHDVAPQSIVHAKLPAFRTASLETPRSEPPQTTAPAASQRPIEAPMMLGVGGLGSVAGSVARDPARVAASTGNNLLKERPGLLLSRARAAEAEAKAALNSAETTAKAANAAAQDALRAAKLARNKLDLNRDEIRRTEQAAKAAVADLAEAERRAKAAERTLNTEKMPRAIERSMKAMFAANNQLATAQAKVEPAKRRAIETAGATNTLKDAVATTDAERIRLAAVAADAAKNLKVLREAHVNAARELSRRMQPVSVLVSRKTGKVHVRQAFQPLFELPVKIDTPEAPIGTHVYTAVANEGANGQMRWNVVAVPSRIETDDGSSRRRSKAETLLPQPKRLPITATAALDRIEIPEDALEIIGEILTPGSSIIVSDEGISNETGKGTDFVILTR